MSVLQPGTVFGGRYVIEKLLAEGGMGAVYVAQHMVTEEKVALKVLWPQVLSSPDAVARFQVEATIAARVGSDYIVKVSDAGFEDALKMPFLVMELLRGKTLQEMVEKRGALTPLEVISVLTQVAAALDKAHRYTNDGRATPIVHRDLKPENIFFTRRENGEPLVKILDFGIAKILSQNTKVSREVKGTPLYMAYEQAMGTAITPQTDLWALGLIAFFLLTGQSYWRSASNPDAELTALIVEIMSLPLDPPSQRIAELGGQPSWGADFDAWFVRMVNRDPTQRYSSAGLAVAELSDALGLGDPTLAVSQLNLARTNIASTRMQSDIIVGIAASQRAPTPPPSGAVAPFSQGPTPSARSLPGSGSIVGVFNRNSTGIREALAEASGAFPQDNQTSAGLGNTIAGAPRTSPLVYVSVGLAIISLCAVGILLLRPTTDSPSPSANAVAGSASVAPPASTPLTPTSTAPSAVASASAAPTPAAGPAKPANAGSTKNADKGKPAGSPGGDSFGTR